MNKKFKNLFLAGALVLGLAGVAVSCTDYDDDINKLQNDVANTNGQVSSLQSTVNELQNKINAGYVITGVSASTKEVGGWVFTTSDGKTYEILNGAKGDKGDKGDQGIQGPQGIQGEDGLTPFIGENGNWWIGEEDLEVPAQGPKGKDGCWYVPNAETACWDKYEIDEATGEIVITATDQKYLPVGFFSVDFDADTNTISIKAGDETFKVTIPDSAASFVFEPQAIVDGEHAMVIKSFTASIYTPNKLDSKDEIWDANIEKSFVKFEEYCEKNKIELDDEGEEAYDLYREWAVENGYLVYEAVPAVATYHVNYGLNLDSTYTYKLIWKDVPVYTRTESSEDFAMDATFKEFKDGKLSLNVTYQGRPATASYTDNHMTQFALQVIKSGRVYTSDYATFVVKDVEQPRIADPIAQVKATANTPSPNKAEALKSVNYEEHYRRGTVGLNGNDDGDYYGDYYDGEDMHYLFAYEYVAPWSENNTLEEAHASCDTAIAWNTTTGLDLNAITIAHYVPENGFCWKLKECCDGEKVPIRPDGTYYYDNEEVENCFELTPAEMEEFGLHFEYEVVKNYKVGKPETDQSNFVKHKNFKIEDGIFWPAVYDVDGTASIGRTPIIRVKLMHGEDIINVAYIKVYIAAVDAINPAVELTPRRDPLDNTSENIFHFYCEGDMLMTTVEDMNKILYNQTNKSKDEFHALYDSITVVLPKDVKDTIGTVRDSVVDPVQGTHVIVWELGPDDLWKYAGKDVSIIARYISKTNTSLYVDVLLKASVAPYDKGVDLKSDKGDYVPEYWTKPSDRGEKGIATRYNVMPAPAGDTVGRGAQMITDINTSFVTYPKGSAKAGQIMVEAVDSVVYYFCKKDVEAITKIGDLNVEFLVDDEDALEAWDIDTEDGVYSYLFAEIQDAKGNALKGYEMQPIAVIINGHDAAQEAAQEILDEDELNVNFYNAFYWIKNEPIGENEDTVFHVADTLINTGSMYTFIGAKAFLCTEDAKEVAVTFDGKDHFQADILRPIEVETLSTGKYVDGVDFGQPGSYISIADLLNPKDWRKRTFAQYPNYWGYYGVKMEDDTYNFEIIIDTDNVECKIAGKRQGIFEGMYIVQVFPDDPDTTINKVTYFKVSDPVRPKRTVYVPKNASGYLMYFNNGRNLTDNFELYVKATLHYGFGYFNTDWVTVPVEKTINQDVPPVNPVSEEPAEPTEPAATEGGE